MGIIGFIVKFCTKVFDLFILRFY